MSFGGWLRDNSEHYLLDAARQTVGTKYDARKVVPLERGLGPMFWRRVFVPTYKLLPWRFRLFVIRKMPGSHRQRWAGPPVRHRPGI